MKINRKIIIYYSIILFLFVILFYITEAIYPTLANIFLSIITGAFIAILMSIINYLYEKEEFFNKLFYDGVFINSCYEQIHIFIEKLNKSSNLDYVDKTLQNYADSLNKLISNIDFNKYSPFLNNSKEAKTVNYIEELLYSTTSKSIIQEIYHIIVKTTKMKIQLSEMNSKEIDQYKIQKYIMMDDLSKNTKALQADYLKKMDYLHKKTKNNTRWAESRRGIIKSTEKNIIDYIKSSININT